MSEYWKSVPRKFCDFCKCWITDNKPSVEFHERGKRHQENVELRLKEVRKKSLQKSIEDEQMSKDMEKMEKAALEAFKRDLKENPELAAKYGVSLEPKPDNAQKQSSLGTPSDKQSKESEATNKKSKKKSKESEAAGKKSKEPSGKEWFETATPDGHQYYWSTLTGESRWDAPDDFLSIAEQEELKSKQSSNSKTPNDNSTDPVSKGNEPVTKKTKEPPKRTILDPKHNRSAYGSWSVVKEVKQPIVYDETSAAPSLEEIPLPLEHSNGPPKERAPKFKEKTVTSLGSSSGESVVFKKRKIAAGARNTRQKDNND
ncbi:WW domain-binding protein 4-like [Physella acuta]|uniref:WW domain-binding protein 4-like n=1 Tax=Physella acuta TaxID=109671 RepID=UPI0027DC3333|nr:WW domain-binding protein 4-like [Physella acuta]